MTNTINSNFSNITRDELMGMLNEEFKNYSISFNFDKNDDIISFILTDNHFDNELHIYKIVSDKCFVYDGCPWNEETTYGKVIKIVDTIDELKNYITTAYEAWWKGLKEIEGDN